MADDSCRIQSVQDHAVSTPPLCRGKSVNALLSATTAEPDFSDVDDILQGERNLLPVDDLVLMNPTSRLPNQASSNVTTTIRDFFLFTNNKTVTDFIDPGPLFIRDCDPNGPEPFNGFPYGMPTPQQTDAVRMFNLDRDVVVTYSMNNRSISSVCKGGTLTTSITIQDPLGLITIPELQVANHSIPFMHSVVADYNQDDYEDVLIFTGASGGLNATLYVYTAVDPDNPEKGVKRVLSTIFPRDTSRNPMSTPVVGDFNGDTITDIAWVGSRANNGASYNVFFMSICPGSTENIPLCQGRSEFEIVLNPLLSQTIPLDTFVNANAEFAYPASALAAGDFNPNPDTSAGDDLMVFYGQAGAGGTAVEYYTFNSSMTPTLRGSAPGPGKIYNVYADSAQFDLTQPGEQAVAALQGAGCFLLIYTFDEEGFIKHDGQWVGGTSGNGTCNQAHQQPSQISLNGMAVGRFTDEVPLSASELAPQIAVFLSDYVQTGNTKFRIRVLEVKPEESLFAKFVSISDGNNSNLSSYFGNANPNRGGSFLRAGDLQGRSLMLGAPSVARIPNFTQIDVIQGSPPMHGAYIQTLNDDAPLVNNFSVIPETFNTAFYRNLQHYKLLRTLHVKLHLLFYARG